MAEDQGGKVEDVVQKILARMFISDFIVKNPTYKKQSGHQKEAADRLVIFKDNLLVYQIKSKQEQKKVSEKTKVDFDRIQNKINKSIAQFKSIREAMNGKLISSVENCRGVVIPFNPDKFKKIIGIVVLELLGEEKFSGNERTKIQGGFLFEHGMPIHIFLREDLELIASEIDTLPDFIHYLSVREMIYKNEILVNPTAERDFLTFFKCKPNLLDEILAGRVDKFLISPGAWRDYHAKHKDLIQKRNQLNEVSFLVDKIISWVHTSIGFIPEVSNLFSTNDLPQGSVENYFSQLQS